MRLVQRHPTVSKLTGIGGVRILLVCSTIPNRRREDANAELGLTATAKARSHKYGWALNLSGLALS